MNPVINPTHDLGLDFSTDRAQVLRINVPHANQNVAPAVIATAMQAIVAAAVIDSSRGRPTSAFGAELITTNRTEFEL